MQLHQKAREIRAASRRGVDLRARSGSAASPAPCSTASSRAARANADRERTALAGRAADLDRAARALAARQARALKTSQAALNAHDPQRTLERGYAVVATRDADPLAGVGRAARGGRSSTC